MDHYSTRGVNHLQIMSIVDDILTAFDFKTICISGQCHYERTEDYIAIEYCLHSLDFLPSCKYY